MTSWTKRIGNCVKVIEHVLNNTLTPNLIYLNLSVEEFPNLIDDLPQDLANLCMSNPIVKLNWIPGKNTKAMKKMLPILRYLDQDDLVMTLDDDTLLATDHIQSRYDDFKSNNGEYCITTCDKFICSNNFFSRKMLNGYELFMTNELMQSGDDDRFYTDMLYFNGYKFICCSDYSIIENKTKHKIYNWFNAIDSLNNEGNHKYAPWHVIVSLFSQRCMELFGKEYKDCYGILRGKDIQTIIKEKIL